MARSYFVSVVLPSVGVPEKGSYTHPEVAKILGKHIRTVRRIIDRGEIVSTAGRVYKHELIAYFERSVQLLAQDEEAA